MSRVADLDGVGTVVLDPEYGMVCGIAGGELDVKRTMWPWFVLVFDVAGLELRSNMSLLCFDDAMTMRALDDGAVEFRFGYSFLRHLSMIWWPDSGAVGWHDDGTGEARLVEPVPMV